MRLVLKQAVFLVRRAEPGQEVTYRRYGYADFHEDYSTLYVRSDDEGELFTLADN